MGKNKLEHFIESATFPHFFQPDFETLDAGFEFKGCWANSFFENDYPITVELGCGKGEYTVGMARKFPDRNFIGIDVKGARMWRGAKTAVEEDLLNVAFIRLKVEQLKYCFADNELDEIWITFPDPQLRKSDRRKRLTAPRFLEMYKAILRPGGKVHLKTDNRTFFDYSKMMVDEAQLNVIFETCDLYNSGYIGEASEIQTFYEKKYLQDKVPINYLIVGYD